MNALSNMLLSLILATTIKYTSSQMNYTKIKYLWREENDNLDFIVGISIRDYPICAGVVLKSNIVLTTVNPLVGFYEIPPEKEADIRDRQIKVHVIYNDWNKNYAVAAILAYPQYLSCSADENPDMDLFSKDCPYTPTHDLITLTTVLNLVYVENKNSLMPTRYAYPINLNMTHRTRIYESGTFTIAGFGYMDEKHVLRNFELEAVDYQVELVLVNCDEWLPKNWGYFICILNVENFTGIESGASLLYNGVFVGLGSFSLMRGNDSILLFTDIRKYKTIFYNDFPVNGTVW